jgi:hypothetical protein
MLSRIRQALDREAPMTAVYIEYTPCDAQMDLVDAAFDYSMTLGAQDRHVTKLPLQRFIFPEVTFIEMVGYGIRPIPIGPDDLHRCLFHGLAVWLKGRSDSWYSPEFRRIAARAYPILHDQVDAFRSPACEPLISSLRGGVYVNRFTTENERLFTVYNARYEDVRGELFRVSAPANAAVFDLWHRRTAQTTGAGGTLTVHGSIEPRSTGVFLLIRP